MLLHQLVVIPMPISAERLLAWPANFGWVGVTLFFVLSGYLITGVLLATREKPRRVSSFYARRALRILPLYFVVLTIVFGIAWLRGGGFGVEELTPLQTASYWLLLPNWAMAAAGDYLVGPLAVTWSVAIEEQFYLVWPAVVWVLRPRTLGWLCGAIVACSLTLRLYGQAAGWDPTTLYVLTLTRVDALALGSLAAVAIRSGFNPRRWRGPLWAMLLVAGVFAAGGDLAGTLTGDPNRYAIAGWSLGPGITLGAIAAAALLLLLSSPDAAPWLSRCFEVRWLRSFGLYSYGIYLTHSPVRALVRDHLYGPGLDGTTPWITFPIVGSSLLPGLFVYMAICVPLCWATGWLSYRLIELPCLRLKNRFPASQDASS